MPYNVIVFYSVVVKAFVSNLRLALLVDFFLLMISVQFSELEYSASYLFKWGSYLCLSYLWNFENFLYWLSKSVDIKLSHFFGCVLPFK